MCLSQNQKKNDRHITVPNLQGQLKNFMTEKSPVVTHVTSLDIIRQS